MALLPYVTNSCCLVARGNFGQDKLGIDNHENSDLADLEMETKPEDVLAEIARLQQRAGSSKKPTA
jgi:hypothetical protein